MFWAIASSVFIIYLYRILNAESAPSPASASEDTVERELAAIAARITSLESKIGKLSAGVPKQ